MIKYCFVLLLLSCAFKDSKAIGFARPDGVYNSLARVIEERQKEDLNLKKQLSNVGLDKGLANKLNQLNTLINSSDGRLVGIKFTSKNELGSKELIRELKLDENLSKKARFFEVDYSCFLDFLHSQIYGKFKISKLEIPSILFFKGGKLILPIEPWDFFKKSSTERIEVLIRERIKDLEDDEALLDIKLSATMNFMN